MGTVRPLLPFFQRHLALGDTPVSFTPSGCLQSIHSAADLADLDNFDLVLRLFDFSAWRTILGRRFSSNYGPPPFDPVSSGLGYCHRHGLDPNDITAESTLRAAPDRTADSLRLPRRHQLYGILANSRLTGQAESGTIQTGAPGDLC